MRDLLEYGKPVPPELRLAELAPLLEQARSSVSAIVISSGVSISIEAEPLPPMRIDPRRLLQVFENLIRNAVQHSPRGGAVEVCVTREGDWALVTVSDRGEGFRSQDLPHVFEPFFTRRRGGTGLGLSLAQRTVEEHGGQIVAETRQGGGARMTVRLRIDPTGVRGLMEAQ
jgi:signal transduction histidine kinase